MELDEGKDWNDTAYGPQAYTFRLDNKTSIPLLATTTTGGDYMDGRPFRLLSTSEYQALFIKGLHGYYETIPVEGV
jgi:hypothetical protein